MVFPGRRSANAPGLSDPVSSTGLGNLEHESPLVHPLHEIPSCEQGPWGLSFSPTATRHFCNSAPEDMIQWWASPHPLATDSPF